MIKRGILWTLLIYSILHYIKTGIIFAYQVPGGDWEAVWPTFWAGTLNPDIISHKSLNYHKMINGKEALWLYGPFLHFLLFPLIFLKSFMTASHIWFMVCQLLFFMTMFLWYKILFLDKKLHSFSTLIFYIFIWFNFFPIYEALATRAPEILELFLITVTIYVYRKGKDYFAGVCLGLAAMTKFLPIGFVPYFFIKKKYKMVFSCAMVLLVLGILTEITLKWKNSETLDLLYLQRNYVEAGTSYECQSIPCFVSRWMSNPSNQYAYSVIKKPFLTRHIVFMVMSFLILFFGWFYWRLRKYPISLFEISILFILMIAFPFRSHPYYLIFLIVPFSVFLQYLFKNTFKIIDIGIYALSFYLVAVIFPLSFLKEIFMWLSLPPFLRLYQYYCIPVYGYLILLLWFVIKQAQHRNDTEYLIQENQ